MTMVVVGLNESWHWESILHDQLYVLVRSLEQIFEALVLLLFMVSSLLPLVDVLTQPHAHIEVSVQQQYYIGFHALNVEHDGSRLRRFECVLQKGWLNHH